MRDKVEVLKRLQTQAGLAKHICNACGEGFKYKCRHEGPNAAARYILELRKEIKKNEDENAQSS